MSDQRSKKSFRGNLIFNWMTKVVVCLLGSRSEGRKFESQPNTTWIWCKSHVMSGRLLVPGPSFVCQTLSRQKFLEVLTTRPSAVRQFVSYLTSRSELSELIDILSGLGRYNEAGLLIYKQALANTGGGNYDARAQRLKIITSQLHNHSDLAHVKGKHWR